MPVDGSGSNGLSVGVDGVSAGVVGVVGVDGVSAGVDGAALPAPVPLTIIFCIALYVSLDNSFDDTTFPFNVFVMYVSVTKPFDPACFTFSCPDG